MTLLPNSVSLEENLHDVDAVSLAAHQANDASTEEQDGSVLGKGDTFSFLFFYRPRRTASSGSSHGPASAAVEAAAAVADDQEEVIPSINKRQPSLLDNVDEIITMAPPKKIMKKNHRRITDFQLDGGANQTMHPTHLLFNQYPKAPKKVSRTKRRVLCSVIGCSHTSFHNGGLCFNHGGNLAINPINLFSTHQTQRCVAGGTE
jgi:hypothetical protein